MREPTNNSFIFKVAISGLALSAFLFLCAETVSGYNSTVALAMVGFYLLCASCILYGVSTGTGLRYTTDYSERADEFFTTLFSSVILSLGLLVVYGIVGSVLQKSGTIGVKVEYLEKTVARAGDGSFQTCFKVKVLDAPENLGGKELCLRKETSMSDVEIEKFSRVAEVLDKSSPGSQHYLNITRFSPEAFATNHNLHGLYHLYAELPTEDPKK